MGGTRGNLRRHPHRQFCLWSQEARSGGFSIFSGFWPNSDRLHPCPTFTHRIQGSPKNTFTSFPVFFPRFQHNSASRALSPRPVRQQVCQAIRKFCRLLRKLCQLGSQPQETELPREGLLWRTRMMLLWRRVRQLRRHYCRWSTNRP